MTDINTATPDTSTLVDQDPAVVKAGGETFTVVQFDTYQTLKAMGSLFKIVKSLQGDGAVNVIEAFALVPDAVVDVVAVGIRRDVDFIMALPPDETIALASAVLDANTSFFIERVLPAVSKLASKITKTISQ